MTDKNCYCLYFTENEILPIRIENKNDTGEIETVVNQLFGDDALLVHNDEYNLAVFEHKDNKKATRDEVVLLHFPSGVFCRVGSLLTLVTAMSRPKKFRDVEFTAGFYSAFSHAELTFFLNECLVNFANMISVERFRTQLKIPHLSGEQFNEFLAQQKRR